MTTLTTDLTGFLPEPAVIAAQVAAALAEDVGAGDLTAALIPAEQRTRAELITREAATLCGSAWFEMVFKQLDPNCRVSWAAHDGERIAPGQRLCSLEGNSRALLTGERTAMNYLQMLSGTATRARQFADAVAVGNALPGPIAPQVSAYVGYKLAGVAGAISAAAGTVLPTTILMLIMIVFFFGIKDSPTVKAMLQAVRPLVVGLLIWTAYDMFMTVFGVKKLGWAAALSGGWDKLLIVGISFALLTFTSLNPVVLVIAAAILGLFVYK